jgi:hypothetical protein
MLRLMPKLYVKFYSQREKIQALPVHMNIVLDPDSKYIQNVMYIIFQLVIKKEKSSFTLPHFTFKIKRNGAFRARIVAFGFNQVSGFDFNESFALVINDVSFRVMLIARLIWELGFNHHC